MDFRKFMAFSKLISGFKESIRSDKEWLTKIFRNGGGNGSLFSFGKEFKSCFINNSIIINRLEKIYPVLISVLYMGIISKDFSIKDYIGDLKRRFNSELVGLGWRDELAAWPYVYQDDSRIYF